MRTSIITIRTVKAVPPPPRVEPLARAAAISTWPAFVDLLPNASAPLAPGGRTGGGPGERGSLLGPPNEPNSPACPQPQLPEPPGPAMNVKTCKPRTLNHPNLRFLGR